MINPLRDIPLARPGGQWTVVSVTQGTHGKATLQPDGTIKYVPNGNSQFYGSMSDSIIVTLRDSGGLEITRTIDIHSFESISGTFNGLLQPEVNVDPNALPTDLPDGSNGLFTVTLNKNAGITGSVVLQDKTYALAGPLTGPLTFSKTFTVSPGVTRTITFVYDDVSDIWSGRVATSNNIGNDLVGTALRMKANTTDIAGTYTVALSPASTTSTNGYARVTIGNTGSVTLAGEQAWGGTYTASSFVRKDNTIVFYHAPGTAANQQLLAIILDATATATTHEFTGQADWRYKDTRLGGPLSAVPVALDILGSRYTAISATAQVVGVPGTLKLSYDNGVITTVIPATTGPTITIQQGTLASDVFKLTVTRTTGLWTGTLTRGITQIPLKGVTLQTRHYATGFGSTPAQPNGTWILQP